MNVVLPDPWEPQVELDCQEDKEAEELWVAVECQEAVESLENQVQVELKDQVELAELLVN